MESLLGLLPIALCLLLTWAAVRYSRRQQGPELAGPNGKRPYGVRGWLAFFVYCSMGLGPLMSIIRVNQSLSEAEMQYPALLAFDGWHSYKVAISVAVAAVCAWQVFVALQLRNRLVPKSVFHARLLLVAAPLVTCLADAVAGKVFLDVDATAERLGSLMGSWLIAVVWLGYFYKSQRVRNTYGLGRRISQETRTVRSAPTTAESQEAPTPNSQ